MCDLSLKAHSTLLVLQGGSPEGMPLESADAMSWLKAAAYGRVHCFHSVLRDANLPGRRASVFGLSAASSCRQIKSIAQEARHPEACNLHKVACEIFQAE